MSLLLQALKQIELKAPAETTDELPNRDVAAEPIAPDFSPSTNGIADARAGSDDRAEAEHAPLVQVYAEANTLPIEPPPCETYELIRQYEYSEIATEVALAGPVELRESLTNRQPAIEPLEPAPKAPTAPPHARADHQQLRLAERVVELLPNERRAVIAMLSFDGAELWPLVRHLCGGLAARGAGEVLAIADNQFAPSRTRSGRTFLSDVLCGRAAWRDALVTGSDGVSFIARGDLEATEMSAGRSLLRLWQEMSDRFAYVVLDATSRQPGAALSLLASCDAAFVVVRLNSTRRREAEQWLERIRSVGGQPCGCLAVE